MTDTYIIDGDESKGNEIIKDSKDMTSNLKNFISDMLASNGTEDKDVRMDIVASYGLQQIISSIIYDVNNDMYKIASSYFGSSSLGSIDDDSIEADHKEESHRNLYKLILRNIVIVFNMTNTKATPKMGHMFLSKLTSFIDDGIDQFLINVILKESSVKNRSLQYLDHEISHLNKMNSEGSVKSKKNVDFIFSGNYPYPALGLSEDLKESLKNELETITKTSVRDTVANLKVIKNYDTPLINAFNTISQASYNFILIPRKFINITIGNSKWVVSFVNADMINSIIRQNLPKSLPSSIKYIDWYVSKHQYDILNDKSNSNWKSIALTQVKKASGINKLLPIKTSKDWISYFKNTGSLPELSGDAIRYKEINDNLLSSIKNMYDLLISIDKKYEQIIQMFNSNYKRTGISETLIDSNIEDRIVKSIGVDTYNSFIQNALYLQGHIRSETVQEITAAFITAFNMNPDMYLEDGRIKWEYVETILKYLVLDGLSIKDLQGFGFGIIERPNENNIKIAMTFINNGERHYAISNRIGGFDLYKMMKGSLYLFANRYGVPSNIVEYNSSKSSFNTHTIERRHVVSITYLSLFTQAMFAIGITDRDDIAKIFDVLTSIKSQYNFLIPLTLLCGYLNSVDQSFNKSVEVMMRPFKNILRGMIDLYDNVNPNQRTSIDLTDEDLHKYFVEGSRAYKNGSENGVNYVLPVTSMTHNYIIGCVENPHTQTFDFGGPVPFNTFKDNVFSTLYTTFAKWFIQWPSTDDRLVKFMSIGEDESKRRPINEVIIKLNELSKDAKEYDLKSLLDVKYVNNYDNDFNNLGRMIDDIKQGIRNMLMNDQKLLMKYTGIESFVLPDVLEYSSDRGYGWFKYSDELMSRHSMYKKVALPAGVSANIGVEGYLSVLRYVLRKYYNANQIDDKVNEIMGYTGDNQHDMLVNLRFAVKIYASIENKTPQAKEAYILYKTTGAREQSFKLYEKPIKDSYIVYKKNKFGTIDTYHDGQMIVGIEGGDGVVRIYKVPIINNKMSFKVKSAKYIDSKLNVNDAYSNVYYNLYSLHDPENPINHFPAKSSFKAADRINKLTFNTESPLKMAISEINGTAIQRSFPDLIDRPNIERGYISIIKTNAREGSSNVKKLQRSINLMDKYKFYNENNGYALFSNVNAVIIDSLLTDESNYKIPLSFGVNKNSLVVKNLMDKGITIVSSEPRFAYMKENQIISPNNKWLKIQY